MDGMGKWVEFLWRGAQVGERSIQKLFLMKFMNTWQIISGSKGVIGCIHLFGLL
jgi:hypothetical protein